MLGNVQQAVDASRGFWEFNIGNICVMLGLAGQSWVWLSTSERQHGENKEKIAELVRWKQDHDLDAKQRDEAIVQLREIAAAMKMTAENMAGQMKWVQAELRDLRNRKRGV
jgi:hypothetical protein